MEKIKNHEVRIDKLEREQLSIDVLINHDEIKRMLRMIEENQNQINNVLMPKCASLEDRIDKDVLPRVVKNESNISMLFTKIEELELKIIDKVSQDQLTEELEKKADINALDDLRVSIVEINKLIDEFFEKFADKA